MTNSQRQTFFRSGQVMLTTVLALSGTVLGATTIAGLLMLYQIRQASDIVSSTKSLYAADSGIEWRLCKFFKIDGEICNDAPLCPDSSPEAQGACVLQNSASFKATCTSIIDAGKEAITIQSSGNNQKTFRAFETRLERTAP